jgi:hypothetical protein
LRSSAIGRASSDGEQAGSAELAGRFGFIHATPAKDFLKTCEKRLAPTLQHIIAVTNDLTDMPIDQRPIAFLRLHAEAAPEVEMASDEAFTARVAPISYCARLLYPFA